MGCKKLTYYQRGEAVNGFRKNLRLVRGEKGRSKKNGLNYSTFGSPLPGRQFNSDSYDYGFNGKEEDREGLGGGQSTYDYGFRIYNPALGKFLSVDPLTKSYPWYTPYQFAGNIPIAAIDLDGMEEYWVVNYLNELGDIIRSELKVVRDTEGNLVNRNFTDDDGVNHSSNAVLITTIDVAGNSSVESSNTTDDIEYAKQIMNVDNSPDVRPIKSALKLQGSTGTELEVGSTYEYHSVEIIKTTGMAKVYGKEKSKDLGNRYYPTVKYTMGGKVLGVYDNNFSQAIESMISNFEDSNPNVKIKGYEITVQGSKPGFSEKDAVLILSKIPNTSVHEGPVSGSYNINVVVNYKDVAGEKPVSKSKMVKSN